MVDTESTLSDELSNIGNRLVDNKLSLRLCKTESILSGSKVRTGESARFNVKCKDTNINPKPQESSAPEQNFLSIKTKYLDSETAKLSAAALVQCQFDFAYSS